MSTGIGIDEARTLIGSVVTIFREAGPRGAGGGVVHGRVVAIAQDGAHWQKPPSLVIVADDRADRAGLVPINLVFSVNVEQVAS